VLSSLWRRFRLFAVLGTVFATVVLSVLGCSDDPILGPDDGAPDDSGGSYSTIKRLAPVDSTQSPDSVQSPIPSNPERF